MIVTKKAHLAPHGASRDRRDRRLAAARRHDAGADGRGEHAGESGPPPGRRLPSQRRHLRQVAAEGCRRRFQLSPTLAGWSRSATS